MRFRRPERHRNGVKYKQRLTWVCITSGLHASRFLLTCAWLSLRMDGQGCDQQTDSGGWTRSRQGKTRTSRSTQQARGNSTLNLPYIAQLTDTLRLPEDQRSASGTNIRSMILESIVCRKTKGNRWWNMNELSGIKGRIRTDRC